MGNRTVPCNGVHVRSDCEIASLRPTTRDGGVGGVLVPQRTPILATALPAASALPTCLVGSLAADRCALCHGRPRGARSAALFQACQHRTRDGHLGHLGTGTSLRLAPGRSRLVRGVWTPIFELRQRRCACLRSARRLRSDPGERNSLMTRTWTLARFTAAIQGSLIVSCQAPSGHPLRDTPTIVRLALAAEAGGAAGIRCGGYGGIPDISGVASVTALPVIGMTKEGHTGVVITPTVASAIAVAEAGAAVVAVDATGRPRPDGSTVGDLVDAVHGAGRLVMADVATLGDGAAAVEAGVDVLSTTLSGYTDDSPAGPDPDLPLVEALRHTFPDVIITAEGRYHTPVQAADAIHAGATAVVVGTAITDVAWVTGQFTSALLAASSITGLRVR